MSVHDRDYMKGRTPASPGGPRNSVTRMLIAMAAVIVGVIAVCMAMGMWRGKDLAKAFAGETTPTLVSNDESAFASNLMKVPELLMGAGTGVTPESGAKSDPRRERMETQAWQEFQNHWLKHGDYWYSFETNRAREKEDGLLLIVRLVKMTNVTLKVDFRFTGAPFSEIDRLNGDEWRGVCYFMADARREYLPTFLPKSGWQPWTSGFFTGFGDSAGAIGFNANISNGVWRAWWEDDIFDYGKPLPSEIPKG
jgi:hypothetical protein